jgi:cytochrome c oxidase subunit 2
MRLCQNLFALSALTIAVALLAACGNQSVSTSSGAVDAATQTAEAKPETAKDTEASKGKLVFMQTGCNACHMNSAVGNQYPDLRGLYGSTVKLKDGKTVVADEAYLRESITNPNKAIVAGYPPTMPPYGYLKEEQINQLVAYIKSLKDETPEFKKE